MEKGSTTFVGLDAHKASISVAMLLPGTAQPVEWQCTNDRAAVRRMVRKVMRQAPGEVRLLRGRAVWLRPASGGSRKRARCAWCAPSLVPRKRGERIKTDRRDARKLAELYRAGLLTEVHPPTQEDEATRDRYPDEG